MDGKALRNALNVVHQCRLYNVKAASCFSATPLQRRKDQYRQYSSAPNHQLQGIVSGSSSPPSWTPVVNIRGCAPASATKRTSPRYARSWLLLGGLGITSVAYWLQNDNTVEIAAADGITVNVHAVMEHLRGVLLTSSSTAACHRRWFSNPTDATKQIREEPLPDKLDNEEVDPENPLWRSKQSKPVEKKFQETAIFSGSSNRPLAEAIAECLGTRLGRIRLERFADGEVNLQFQESLRGKDVYIIQPTSPPVNEHIIELLLMVSTARRSSAKKITAVIPYYGYARQDRKLNSRVPISAADVARMIETVGVDRVISVDLHCGQIQGFFGPRVPVDNLEAQIVGLEYFATKKLDRPVVVSPDAGGVYRARKFQEGLQARGAKGVGIAMLVKQRLRANEIERMDLVGNVDGCDVVIVDDMIDTAGTLCEAATQLRKRGAKRVFAFATHGLFSGPALERIEKSPLEEIVVCDTIQRRQEITQSGRITYLSLAVLIADAIRRIHQKESLQQLFCPGV